MSEGLAGKVVLVTGGSRGIGAAISRRFASLGCSVAVGYHANREAADKLVGELAASGRKAIAVKGDMANPDEIDAVVASTVKQFDRIDVLVNCAGIGGNRPLGQMDPAFIRKILDTNVLGTVLTAQAALPHLASPGGRIINISSGLAYRPIPGSSVYSASKAAVAALTHGLAKELGPKGITVNCVAPGVIETDMTTNILAERGDQILAMTPLARIGQPDDIAGIVTFLASPEAGWVTGRTIIADGGLT